MTRRSIPAALRTLPVAVAARRRAARPAPVPTVVAEAMAADPIGATPERQLAPWCNCGPDCEFPCWQRAGLAGRCESCGCAAPAAAGDDQEDDDAAAQAAAEDIAAAELDDRILELAAGGLGRRRIAAQLGVTEHRVRKALRRPDDSG